MSEEETRSRPARVLVVDDNHDAADTLVMLLNLLDYDVQVAYRGLDAISMAERFEPDVVVLDIDMPGMDGLATARLLRQTPFPGPRGVHLIALTALSRNGTEEAISEAGFDLHLQKPVDVEVLRRAISQATLH